jgi:hypothetical protein
MSERMQEPSPHTQDDHPTVVFPAGGVAAEIGADGLARMIAPVRLGGRLSQAWPESWGES